jgi:hypothetical protein
VQRLHHAGDGGREPAVEIVQLFVVQFPSHVLVQ